MIRGIPNYDLYGDLLAGRAPEPIHLEPIRERSRHHDWTIRVHSHARLAQIFFLRSPGVRFSLGELTHLTTRPTVLVVAPGVPHGFRFDEDVVGDVLSVRVDKVSDALQDRFAAFATPTRAVFSEPEAAHFRDVASLFEQLGKAYRGPDSQRFEIMSGLVDVMTLYLLRDRSGAFRPVSTEAEERPGRQHDQARDFCTLLEENFQQPWAVSDYASRMGLSASHLTRICRSVMNAPPNTLVRQRRILEAKRLLEYTSLPLSEIAHLSGFRDTAFFSRTFRALVGTSPNGYRSSLCR